MFSGTKQTFYNGDSVYKLLYDFIIFPHFLGIYDIA